MGPVHPAYLSEYGIEAEDDEVESFGLQRPKAKSKRQLVLRRPLYSSLSFDLMPSKRLPFLAGVGVGLLSVSLVWLVSREPRETPVSVPSLIAPIEPVTPKEEERQIPVSGELGNNNVPTKLEADVELLKRIVSGLVDTVQGLSQRKDTSDVTPDVTEAFPFPVQVTTDKAHLRKSADRASPSIVEVGKDTTLMAFDGTDKWLKVSTPRGEDAWISRSVVVAKRLG
jgi:hypothetical protein